MAETVRTEAVTVLPEYQETFLKDLLASPSALANMPTTIPDYQVAGMTPAQQAAIQLGISGVGAYQPMMEAGAATLGQGVAALQPGAYQQYMNPYVDRICGCKKRCLWGFAAGGGRARTTAQYGGRLC